MSEDTHCYDDIINLPHHVSILHPQMPLGDRAAQFAPFAALTGYDDAILETARLTESRFELDESRQAVLNRYFVLLKEHIKERPEVTLCYFKPDERKTGGAYVTLSGPVKKIDDCRYRLIMMDGTVIPMEDIYDIDGTLFRMLSSDTGEI